MNMKKIIVLLLGVVFTLQVNAQKPNPVKWTFAAVKKSDKQYEVTATATIDAIVDFQNRERRFGMTSEQVSV